MSYTLSAPSQWVDRYGDYLYSFAFYRVQDDSLSRDLVQETLLAALKAKTSFKGSASEKSWLTGILKHKIIDAIRKKYRETAVEDKTIDFKAKEDAFDDKGMWKAGPKDWESDPEQLLNQKDFLAVVDQCLKDLPERPSMALTMKAMDGESTKTICKVLNITPTNAWVILHRARALLRRCIELNWLGGKTDHD